MVYLSIQNTLRINMCKYEKKNWPVLRPLSWKGLYSFSIENYSEDHLKIDSEEKWNKYLNIQIGPYAYKSLCL